MCVVSNKFTLDCLRISGLQLLDIQYDPSWAILNRAVHSERPIVKIILQRLAAITAVCFWKFCSHSVTESLARYTYKFLCSISE